MQDFNVTSENKINISQLLQQSEQKSNNRTPIK